MLDLGFVPSWDKHSLPLQPAVDSDAVLRPKAVAAAAIVVKASFSVLEDLIAFAVLLEAAYTAVDGYPDFEVLPPRIAVRDLCTEKNMPEFHVLGPLFAAVVAAVAVVRFDGPAADEEVVDAVELVPALVPVIVAFRQISLVPAEAEIGAVVNFGQVDAFVQVLAADEPVPVGAVAIAPAVDSFVAQLAVVYEIVSRPDSPAATDVENAVAYLGAVVTGIVIAVFETPALVSLYAVLAVIAVVHIAAAVLFFQAASVLVAGALVEARLQVLVFVADAAHSDIVGAVVPVVDAHFVSAAPWNQNVAAEPEFDPARLVLPSRSKHVR